MLISFFKFVNICDVLYLLLAGGDIITTEESFSLLDSLLGFGVDIATGGAILSWYELILCYWYVTNKWTDDPKVSV